MVSRCRQVITFDQLPPRTDAYCSILFLKVEENCPSNIPCTQIQWMKSWPVQWTKVPRRNGKQGRTCNYKMRNTHECQPQMCSDFMQARPLWLRSQLWGTLCLTNCMGLCGDWDQGRPLLASSHLWPGASGLAVWAQWQVTEWHSQDMAGLRWPCWENPSLLQVHSLSNQVAALKTHDLLQETRGRPLLSRGFSNPSSPHTRRSMWDSSPHPVPRSIPSLGAPVPLQTVLWGKALP